MQRSSIRRLVVTSFLFCTFALAGTTGLAAEPEANADPVKAYTPQPHGGSSHGGLWFGSPNYRSPGLAVILSLTPMPIDFGNLYAENLGWGMTYTALELSLARPLMWLTGR